MFLRIVFFPKEESGSPNHHGGKRATFSNNVVSPISYSFSAWFVKRKQVLKTLTRLIKATWRRLDETTSLCKYRKF